MSSMRFDAFEQQVLFSTVRIVMHPPDGEGITSQGTGFLLGVPLDDRSDRQIVLLISNKHVFGDGAHRITTELCRRQDAENVPDTGKTVSFLKNTFHDAYIEHPDPAIDVAAINVTNALVQSPVFYKSIPRAMIADIPNEPILPGASVVFVGYPDNRYDEVNKLPIMRSGIVASHPDADYGGKPLVVIDAQVVAGSSGSPVFVNNSERAQWRLLGILAQTMIRDNVLQVLPVGIGLGVKQVIGLGLAYKASVLHALCDAALARWAPPT